MAWRSGVVTEFFPWGVHFHFDDEDRIESFTYDQLKPLGDAPKTTARPRPAPPAGAVSGSRAGSGYATNGKGDYRAGYGAGVKFRTQTPATTPAKRLVPNSYNCAAFIGTPPNGYLSKTGGFTISGTSYRYQDGTRGTVSMSGGVLKFHGGALDGQAATYDAGATGRGQYISTTPAARAPSLIAMVAEQNCGGERRLCAPSAAIRGEQ